MSGKQYPFDGPKHWPLKSPGLNGPSDPKWKAAQERREKYLADHAYIPGVTKGAYPSPPRKRGKEGNEPEEANEAEAA